MSCNTNGGCKGGKLVVWALGLVAVLAAIFSITQVRDLLIVQAYVTHFFEVLLPILGVIAVLKYLCCCKNRCGGCCSSTACGTDKTACADTSKQGCCK